MRPVKIIYQVRNDRVTRIAIIEYFNKTSIFISCVVLAVTWKATSIHFNEKHDEDETFPGSNKWIFWRIYGKKIYLLALLSTAN